MLELRALYHLASSFNAPGNHILEVGSYKGKSTVALALGAPEASITAVDTWYTNPDPRARDYVQRATYESFLKSTGFAKNLSHKVGVLETSDIRSETRLIFLDGDHRYGPVSENLRVILGTAAPGTLVAFHDFAPGENYGGGGFPGRHRSPRPAPSHRTDPTSLHR